MPEKLRRISLTLCALSVFIVLLNCKAAQKNDQKPSVAFENLVKSKVGAKYKVDYNVSKTYALCQQERAEDHIRRNIKYIVVRLSDNKVINEGFYSMGYVKWFDNNSIEVLSSSIQGTERAGEKKIIKLNADL
jgi:hypothetical protein